MNAFMNSPYPSKPPRQGFSLIELLLVLAVIAALATASFVIFPRIRDARQASEQAEVAQVEKIRAGIRARAAGVAPPTTLVVPGENPRDHDCERTHECVPVYDGARAH